MITTFETLPFVYQIEALIHVSWYAETGIQDPYTCQTLEEDLKQEALRIWQEEKYESNNILRNLTTNNDRKGGVVTVMERLLRYKKTGQFGDVDNLYRDKEMMNNLYKKQVQDLNKLSSFLFPNQPYNFTQLKQEVTRLKYQELAPQVRKEKERLEQLITNAKTKVGNFEKIIDLLLETQKQISEIEPESNDYYRTEGRLTAYQSILESNLGKEEIQTLLNKQTEFLDLERHLESLQQNSQLSNSSPNQPFDIPDFSKGGNQ